MQVKVLFTADIHIKLGQKNVPVEWAKARYQRLFKTICDLCISEKINLLIIGGDIFDKVPSMAELELYFDLLMQIRCETVIYSGNHEADKKNTTFLSNLKNISRYISGVDRSESSHITIIDDFDSFYGIDFIPYNKLKEYHPADIDFHSRILCTHVRGAIPPHVQPEIDLELLARWDLVLAGDLHSYSNSQRNILYPGSPVTTSFHRSLVDTGVIILDTETLQHEWVKLDMPQLLRKTIAAGEPMPQTEYHHTIYEVTGNMADMASTTDTELLDKKIVDKSSEAALILNNMSIEQELTEYLLYILNLTEAQVKEITTEFIDNVGHSIDL